MLTTERARNDRQPSRIWLWRGDAGRLAWQRERVLLEFDRDPTHTDLGYPWMLSVAGRRWLLFWYHGQVRGACPLWVADVDL